MACRGTALLYLLIDIYFDNCIIFDMSFICTESQLKSPSKFHDKPMVLLYFTFYIYGVGIVPNASQLIAVES
jgi:hypothetical protein